MWIYVGFLVGRGETPVRPGTSASGGGQDKECVLKLLWPSTAEYRMMEEKKKPGLTSLSS